MLLQHPGTLDLLVFLQLLRERLQQVAYRLLSAPSHGRGHGHGHGHGHGDDSGRNASGEAAALAALDSGHHPHQHRHRKVVLPANLVGDELATRATELVVGDEIFQTF